VTEKRWREVFLLTVGMLDNADALLRLMKARLDGLLAGYEKLQSFLVLVNQKCSNIQVNNAQLIDIHEFYSSLVLKPRLTSILQRLHFRAIQNWLTCYKPSIFDDVTRYSEAAHHILQITFFSDENC
jgi:hypothetical protein